MSPERNRTTIRGGNLRLTLARPDGTRLSAKLVNVGPGGISVRLQEPVAPGEELTLELTLNHHKTIRCRGRVVWSRQDEGRSGLCFVDLDDYATRMLALWLRPPGLNRRDT